MLLIDQPGYTELPVQEICENLYALSAAAKKDRATDLIISYCDDLFAAGNFTRVNELLEQVDVTKLCAYEMCSLLMVTNSTKEKLPYRPKLLGVILTELVKQIGLDDALRYIRNKI